MCGHGGHHGQVQQQGQQGHRINFTHSANLTSGLLRHVRVARFELEPELGSTVVWRGVVWCSVGNRDTQVAVWSDAVLHGMA